MLRKEIANSGRAPVFRWCDAIRLAPRGLGCGVGSGGGGVVSEGTGEFGSPYDRKASCENGTAGLIGAPVFITESRRRHHHRYQIGKHAPPHLHPLPPPTPRLETGSACRQTLKSHAPV